MSGDESPQKILKELVYSMSKGATAAVIDKILGKLSKLANRKKYGFSASHKMGNALAEISKRDAFKRLKECVGADHWAIDFCRVGLVVAESNRLGEKIDISSIKTEALSREGPKGVTVINMGSTGAIHSVIAYLSKLKLENLLTEDIAKKFDKMIENWDRITIFVKGDDSISSTKSKILKLIKNENEVFWIFGYGSARMIACKAIAELNNERKILENDYIWDPDHIKDGSGKDVVSFAFKLCY